MITTGFHHLLHQAAYRFPSNPAISFGAQTIAYQDLWQGVLGLAAELGDMGLARGDRVALYLEKRPETVTTLFAISAAGAMFVPINPLLRAHQAGFILADSDARILVTSADRLALLAPSIQALPSLQHVIVIDANVMPILPGLAIHAWTGSEVTDGFRPHEPLDIDLAAILYTSGSTGQPKGVVLSHRNLIAGAQSVSHYLGNRSQDVILSALPLSFDAGLSQLTTAFLVGAHVVLLNYLLPQDVPRLCLRHGVTGITAVPPLWIQLADIAWPDAAREKLRYFANTGGRMPKAVLDRLRWQFPQAAPFLMYGLTEAFRSTYLDPDQIDRRPDSIGKAIPNAEILVLRPDGTPCAPDEEGELVHCGALVAQGYWDDAPRTAERFRPIARPDQPWRPPEIAVYSGDIVRRDEEGFLYYVGRRDEMIKTSGYRVSPTEIEEAAFDTCLVQDVVALGLEDERLGQRVVLIASPSGAGPLDVAALLSGMRQRLPLYMVPSQILERSFIPRSPNGKFDRTLLRQELTP